MRRSWWRRNGGWLLAMPLILALTIAASSQRMVNTHLRWRNINPVTAVDGTAHLSQDFEYFEEQHRLEVTATVVSISNPDHLEEGWRTLVAAPGGVLWQIDVEFRADPDQILPPCQGLLVSDGVKYGPNAAKVDVKTGDHGGLPGTYLLQCVPPDTPGPRFDPFSSRIEPAETPRPAHWVSSFTFVLPAGVTPEELHLWWHEPQYLRFPLEADR